MVEVEDLVRRFGRLTAVGGIAFSVRHGEIFGILGPNGAGKTTLIRMLSTLLRPHGGRGTVAGWDIRRHPRQVRRETGLVFQEPSLDYRMTAEENLVMHGLLYGIPRSTLQKRVTEALHFVKLEDRRGLLVRNFSGGMRRRLELARAFLHDPPVLILDEPTIGLDPQTRRSIWDYLFRLRRMRRVTVLVTTHYMEEAEHCDRLAIIDGGRLIALGSPAELCSRASEECGTTVSTLEDVFLRLTGRSFRDETGGDLRAFMRLKGGSR